MAKIAIIGGSGFYELLEGEVENRVIHTPYGEESSAISVGKIAGKEVLFMPRHGTGHRYPPHLIPYRANLWALKELGAEIVIGPSAVGSLKKEYALGHFVIPDQFVDRTFGVRKDTYVEVGEVHHLSAAEIYDQKLSQKAEDACKETGVEVHRGGTVVVINGPRFSSRAESQWFQKMGWDIISMTQYPENVLAAELKMRYVNIGLVTDYDAGIELESGKMGKPVTHDGVFEVMKKNVDNLKLVIEKLISKL